LTSTETKAITLRYGLTKEEPKRAKWRDYEAEVEESIFCASSAMATPAAAGGKKGEALSFKEVGLTLGVSAEYGRRLCNKAIEKLKTAVKRGDINRAELAWMT